MRATLLFFVAAGFCSALRGGPIDLTAVVKAGNVYADSKYEISAKFPAGWSVVSAIRWGAHNEGENTVRFRVPSPSLATPAMYYASF